MSRNYKKKNNASRPGGMAGSAVQKNVKGKNKERYYAFFDAEYTCYMENDRGFDRAHSNEVLSVGLVVSDRNFNLIRSFYSPVRPKYNRRLTGYCKSLTGLKQSEIDEAPSYDEVFQELHNILAEYPVGEIYVWGSDGKTLNDDLQKNHKSISKRHKRIVGMVRDVTKRLTARVFGSGLTISLADMKYICGMERRTEHNALADARDLYEVARCCVTETYDKERAEKLYHFIQERNIYHQCRRFKHPEQARKERNPNMKKISKTYVDALEEMYGGDGHKLPPEIRALCDDVRSLAGMQAAYCPRLEE